MSLNIVCVSQNKGGGVNIISCNRSEVSEGSMEGTDGRGPLVTTQKRWTGKDLKA